MANTTNRLTQLLQQTAPEQLEEVLQQHEDKWVTATHPFAEELRRLLQKYQLTQNYLVERAGFSLPYGYRLLSEERHTKQRDYILRFCLVAGFSFEEIQRLLTLYGMSPLYARVPRDAVLIAAIAAKITDLNEINRLLCQHQLQELLASEGYSTPNQVY